MIKIELCPNCGGQGTTELRERGGYVTTKCDRCEGTGRLQHVTYSTYIPFGATLDPNTDEKIHKLINKLKK